MVAVLVRTVVAARAATRQVEATLPVGVGRTAEINRSFLKSKPAVARPPVSFFLAIFVYPMKRILLLAMLATACSRGQESSQKTDTTAIDPNGEKVITTKYKEGGIKSEVRYKQGAKNGIARSYDRDGSLVLELPYVNNKKEGTSKKYFAGGKVLAQTTEYKNDKMNGAQVRYRGNGELLSEARYEDDRPCLGLKEYLENGSLKKKYPTVQVKVVDNISTSGIYKLKFSLSERSKSIKFYQGKLSKSGCLHDGMEYLLMDEATRTGEVSYYLNPGFFVMEELNVVAVFETLMGNTAIVQYTHHVAVDNR